MDNYLDQPTYEELAQRNKALLDAQAVLKNQFLEQQRTITTVRRELDTKGEELCSVQVKLAEMTAQNQLLRRSLNQFKDMNKKGKRSLTNAMRQGAEGLKPTIGALSALAKTDLGELFDKDKAKISSTDSKQAPGEVQWRSVTKYLPQKTGLYRVSDGHETELAYFDVKTRAFAVKSVEVQYWTNQVQSACPDD